MARASLRPSHTPAPLQPRIWRRARPRSGSRSSAPTATATATSASPSPPSPPSLHLMVSDSMRPKPRSCPPWCSSPSVLSRRRRLPTGCVRTWGHLRRPENGRPGGRPPLQQRPLRQHAAHRVQTNTGRAQRDQGVIHEIRPLLRRLLRITVRTRHRQLRCLLPQLLEPPVPVR
jgi:hypothetical protein